MEPSSKGQTTMSVNNLGPQQLAAANKQIAQVDLLPRFHTTMPISMGPQQLSLAEKQFVQAKVQASLPGDIGPYQFFPTSKQPLQMGASAQAQIPIPVRQHLQQLTSISKRPTETGNLLNIHNSMSISPGSISSLSANKKQVQMISSSKLRPITYYNLGSQQTSTTNKRPAQTGALPKAQTESFQSVRSKLRESLAAALAMVSSQKNKQQIIQKSDDSKEKESTQKQAEIACRTNEVGTASESALSANSSEISASNSLKGKMESQNVESDIVATDMQESQPKHTVLEDDVLLSNNSIVKDELLQGHGLCWVSDPAASHEGITNPVLKKPKVAHEEETVDVQGATVQNPEALAFKIEAELFRLYGGVNKKYKEKGRSLLFNLKDRNNPDLREKVMSGDIAPERLCSMTAEELASKELSEWRIAKAEELAQMVVLPDSDVDIRRLVRKTHKGEFQVEVERDDSVSVEVALGANVLSPLPVKPNDGEAQTRGKSKRRGVLAGSRTNESKATEGSLSGEKADLGDQNPANNLDAISDEKADLMQELMVDELKGTELLPPIVSLDEFMEALDSEPPFEDLQMNRVENVQSFDDEKSESLQTEKNPALNEFSPRGDPASDSSDSKPDSVQTSMISKSNPANTNSEDPVVTVTDNVGKADVEDANGDNNMKSGSPCHDLDASAATSSPKGEIIWEGLIQLNISSLVTVIGFFKSGERAATKEWPSLLEIKGRVRLDAFEKFLQELPLSRTRATMIVQFCWKEGSPENGRLSLSETVDSYIADGRVGFAEPAPGMELYFCPPHMRTSEMLGKHLQKEHCEILNAAVNGLIGVVVWRRPVFSISPRVSSHSKHSSAKRQLSSGRRQNANPILSFRNSQAPRPLGPPSNPAPREEETFDDDVPPGFGPGARDDDDLPEFDFVHGNSRVSSRSISQSSVSGMTRHRSARPAEHMRELVHKYGQSGSAKKSVLDIQPWNDEDDQNDDDDDDIPEWKPQQNKQPEPQSQPLPPPPPPPPTQMHVYQQQSMQPVLLNQQMIQMTPQLQQQQQQQQQIPQPHLQPQQLLQFGAPMAMQMPLQPPMQPQMGMMPIQPSMQPAWQPAPVWPPAPPRGPADVGLAMNSAAQLPHLGSQLGDGQIYGMPGFGVSPNGMGWRH